MNFISSSVKYDAVHEEDRDSASISVDHETVCWGCGLRFLVSPYESVQKCSFCGAITKHNAVKRDKHSRWRHLLGPCSISIAFLFMLFFICGGIWAVYPTIFSVGYSFGVFHLTVAEVLSISTLSSFCFAAFQPAGSPPAIAWGSYPTVGRGALENYTFCNYCSKPKPPRTHHCRSCGMCIMDMDHHCPFIGNCVGAQNHRSFIISLISTVISMVYVASMASYVASSMWSHRDHWSVNLSNGDANTDSIFRVFKESFHSILTIALFLPARGLILIYLILTSVSVAISLCVLLWQQLYCIYTGQAYLSELRSVDTEEKTEKGCQNLIRFFSCSHNAALYLPSYWKSRKSHEK